MDNAERDKKISETHDAVIVMVNQVKNHDEALFGNGKEGLVTDVTLLQERQDTCPARMATTVQSKRLSLGNVMLGITIVTVLINIALTVWKNSS